MSNLFGWDLLYSSIERDIKSNQDILISLTHLVLVSNGFKCIGLGESKIYEGNEPQTEALPRGWNDEYAIRYVYQGRLYNLKGTRLDDGVVINLIRVDERNVAVVQLNNRMVIKRSGTLNEMIPDNSNITDVIKKQLIDSIIVSKKQQDSACQTNPGRSQGVIPHFPSSLCEPGGVVPHISTPPFGMGGIGVGGGVGSADLNPFASGPHLPNPLGGVGGGGMIFVPPRGIGNVPPPLGIPPGSLPPGARFDPFRPPEVDRYRPGPRRPDNDEFPPPGFDDMYM